MPTYKIINGEEFKHCECGFCDEWIPRWYSKQRERNVAAGHQNRKSYKVKEPKLCECGCGEETMLGCDGNRNRFVVGHNSKGANNPMYGKNPSGSTAHRLEEWQKQVFERDGYACQNPNCPQNTDLLDAHHIKSRKDYPELLYDLENGVTLCRSCHVSTHQKGKPKSNESKIKNGDWHINNWSNKSEEEKERFREKMKIINHQNWDKRKAKVVGG